MLSRIAFGRDKSRALSSSAFSSWLSFSSAFSPLMFRSSGSCSSKTPLALHVLPVFQVMEEATHSTPWGNLLSEAASSYQNARLRKCGIAKFPFTQRAPSINPTNQLSEIPQSRNPAFPQSPVHINNLEINSARRFTPNFRKICRR